MSPITISPRLLLAVFLACILLSNKNEVTAQFETLIPIHEFFDGKGVPLTVGTAVLLNESSVRVRDGLGDHHDIERKELSTNSRKFLKSLEVTKANYEKQFLNADKLVEKLGRGSRSTKLKTLDKIAKIGMPAGKHTDALLEIAQSDPDLAVAAQALATGLAICPGDKNSLIKVFQVVQQNVELRNAIAASPNQFYDRISKFGVNAQPILIDAAYTGTFKLAIREKVAAPLDLTTTDGNKNMIRAAACFSLAKIKSSSAATALLATAKSASKKIDGAYDAETTRQIILGLAASGQSPHSTFRPIRSENVVRFKKEVKLWLESAKRKQKETAETNRLVRLSRMKSYLDGSGKFLIRGELESVSDQKAIFVNHRLERVSVPLRSFGKASLEWIMNDIAERSKNEK